MILMLTFLLLLPINICFAAIKLPHSPHALVRRTLTKRVEYTELLEQTKDGMREVLRERANLNHEGAAVLAAIKQLGQQGVWQGAAITRANAILDGIRARHATTTHRLNGIEDAYTIQVLRHYQRVRTVRPGPQLRQWMEQEGHPETALSSEVQGCIQELQAMLPSGHR